MTDSTIVMKVPEEIIKAQVQAAIVASLTANGGQMVAQVVTAVLNEKKDSYGRETKLDGLVKDLIMGVARDAMKEWLEGNRDAIRAEMNAALNKGTKTRIKNVVDALCDGMAKNMSLNVKIGWES